MHLIFYIISPFLTFLYSCFDLRKRTAQIVFVLFFGLFGYCHTFEDSRADSFRKYESFSNYAAEEYGDIYDNFRAGEEKDIYEDLLFSTLKLFTDNPHIMMMVVGLVAGIFYMLVTKRFLEDRVMEYTWPIAILVIMFIFNLNIPQLGGIRSFTAFPIFTYSLIRLIFDGKRAAIIGILIAPLIHFGYILAAIVAIVAWLLRIPSALMHYIAIFTCFASIFLDTSSYAGALDFVLGSVGNEAIESRIANYGSAETDMAFNMSLTTRLIRLNNQISAIFLIALMVYLRRNWSQLHTSPYTSRLYNVLLLFIIVRYALICYSVVGQRFVYIAMVLLYMFMLNLYQENRNTSVKTFIYMMPIVCSLHIMWNIYNCYCNTGLDIYYQPLPILMLKYLH